MLLSIIVTLYRNDAINKGEMTMTMLMNKEMTTEQQEIYSNMISQTYYADINGAVKSYDDWKDDARMDGWNFEAEIRGGGLVELSDSEIKSMFLSAIIIPEYGLIKG